MTESDRVLQLQDLDLFRAELAPASRLSRLRKLGFAEANLAPLDRARERMIADLDRRWWYYYERAQARFGRAVAFVQGRVCQGCFITLPTSAAPSGDFALTVCESCGRILHWR